ncbi:hypothetical protein OROMI_013200 [Orobanche minor]
MNAKMKGSTSAENRNTVRTETVVLAALAPKDIVVMR